MVDKTLRISADITTDLADEELSGAVVEKLRELSYVHTVSVGVYDGTAHNRILLASREKDDETLAVLYLLIGADMQFVTWVARKDNPRGTFWGHYFSDIGAAVADFEKR